MTSPRSELGQVQPNVQVGTGTVASPTVRTSVQSFTPALVLEGLRVFGIWEPEPQQLTWILATGVPLAAFLMNLYEKHRGRRLIGRAVVVADVAPSGEVTGEVSDVVLGQIEGEGKL